MQNKTNQKPKNKNKTKNKKQKKKNQTKPKINQQSFHFLLMINTQHFSNEI
jgi:hypothetical protein